MNRRVMAIGCALLLGVACGDGGKTFDVPPDASKTDVADGSAGQYSVSVTVSGLRADLAVILNTGSEQVITEDGQSILGGLDVGANYEVVVGTQPGIQHCQVEGGSGTISDSDVQVSISCELLIFTTMSDGVNGTEWWKSDGTEAGTVMLRNIGAGAQGGAFEPEYAFLPRDYVVFMAADEANGVQLWKSDGTEAGTTTVKLINENGGAGIGDFVEFSGQVYFVGFNGADGYELWKTDGTADGTVMVRNFDSGPGNSVVQLRTVVMGSSLYFVTSIISEGLALWKTDGTSEGTVMVKIIETDSFNAVPHLVVMGNAIYFSAKGNALGQELWKSDGTAEGTVMVKDINPESAGSYPGFLTAIGDTLYFSASQPGSDRVLWKTDGTESGTVEVLGTAGGGPSALHSPLAFDGKLYFAATSAAYGMEVWQSDGSAAGTVLLKDINATGAGANSNPGHFSLVPGGLVFSASNGTSGRELWRSDGTEAGTEALAEIYPGSESSGAMKWGDKTVTFHDSVLYFGNDGTGMQPYLVDLDGATKIKEVNPTGSALINQ